MFRSRTGLAGPRAEKWGKTEITLTRNQKKIKLLSARDSTFLDMDLCFRSRVTWYFNFIPFTGLYL